MGITGKSGTYGGYDFQSFKRSLMGPRIHNLKKPQRDASKTPLDAVTSEVAKTTSVSLPGMNGIIKGG